MDNTTKSWDPNILQQLNSSWSHPVDAVFQNCCGIKMVLLGLDICCQKPFGHEGNHEADHTGVHLTWQ